MKPGYKKTVCPFDETVECGPQGPCRELALIGGELKEVYRCPHRKGVLPKYGP